MRYQPKDAYHRRARREHYRSRAAYKLIELQRRYRILRTGDAAIDLGAAPGAWLQVAAAIVGPRGKVVGIDLEAIAPLPESNVECLRGDVLDPAVRERALAALGRPPSAILSDMSPKLTGVRPRDEARAAELIAAALDFATSTLAGGGRLVVKVIAGVEAAPIAAAVRGRFESVKFTRPDATRKGSTESYLVAVGFRS